MPLFDYECATCLTRREVLVPKSDTQVVCQVCSGHLPVFMMKLPAAPSFKVTGFNSLTGYASERVIRQRFGSIKTEVRGNLEAFDRLHS